MRRIDHAVGEHFVERHRSVRRLCHVFEALRRRFLVAAPAISESGKERLQSNACCAERIALINFEGGSDSSALSEKAFNLLGGDGVDAAAKTHELHELCGSALPYERCCTVEPGVEGPLIDDLDVAWNRCEVRYGVFRDDFSAHGFNQGGESVINERVKMVGPPGEHDERFARGFMPAPQCFARLTQCCAVVFERCMSGIDRLTHFFGGKGRPRGCDRANDAFGKLKIYERREDAGVRERGGEREAHGFRIAARHGTGKAPVDMLFARMSGAFERHAGHPDVSNAFAGEVSGMAVSEFCRKAQALRRHGFRGARCEGMVGRARELHAKA